MDVDPDKADPPSALPQAYKPPAAMGANMPAGVPSIGAAAVSNSTAPLDSASPDADPDAAMGSSSASLDSEGQASTTFSPFADSGGPSVPSALPSTTIPIPAASSASPDAPTEDDIAAAAGPDVIPHSLSNNSLTFLPSKDAPASIESATEPSSNPSAMVDLGADPTVNDAAAPDSAQAVRNRRHQGY